MHTNYIAVTVNIQPVNTTVCLKGKAVFTCVLDVRDDSIDMSSISWWRSRSNQAVAVRRNNRFSVNNTRSSYTITSVLTIANVLMHHVGAYWLGLNDKSLLSNMAFLSITSKGYTYLHTYVGLIMYTCYIHSYSITKLL